MYKSLCRNLKRRYDQQLIKKLEALQAADSNNFWNLLKQLKIGGKFVSGKEGLPPLYEMQVHYMKLLQKQIVCNSFNNEKIKLRNKLNLDQLNKPFDLEEIKQGIKRLKTKKAQGIDCISSEMIKCSNNALLSKITKLFNLILDIGYYPETWNHGLIHSIHKNGSKMDPSNYRGITLLSSLGKLFSSLIYNRIENEIESKDILSPSQAGFRKNYRTTDHIFTLFSLIKKALCKGKYLHTCFGNFRKAYDSIC